MPTQDATASHERPAPEPSWHHQRPRVRSPAHDVVSSVGKWTAKTGLRVTPTPNVRAPRSPGSGDVRTDVHLARLTWTKLPWFSIHWMSCPREWNSPGTARKRRLDVSTLIRVKAAAAHVAVHRDALRAVGNQRSSDYERNRRTATQSGSTRRTGRLNWASGVSHSRPSLRLAVEMRPRDPAPPSRPSQRVGPVDQRSAC
jgi:hypothetical protein